MSAQQQLINQRLAERDRCRHDKLYLAQILGYDFQPEVHTELFAQYIPFRDDVPYSTQSDIKNRMILWPRGHYKTTSIVVEIIQTILNFPDIRILLMQGSLKTTQRLMREIASHFTAAAAKSRLPHLFPEFCGTKKALGFTNEGFTVPCRKQKQLQAGTITCASPKAIMTGQHYDVGFFDDLIHQNNYRNPNLIQKAIEDFTMAQPLIDPGGYRYVTGTRYAFGDLYEVIAEWALRTEGSWRISIKTCYTDNGTGIRFPQTTTTDGRLIGFTRELLEQIKRDDPGVFSSQYLNQPLAISEQLFTDAAMAGACIGAETAPSLSYPILFVDLAAGDLFHNDDSVILCARTDSQGIIYVTDCVGGQWVPGNLAIQIIAMALKHRPVRIMIEKTASCTYFVEYLRLLCHQKGIQLPIDFIKIDNHKDAKRTRIAALEGFIRSKRLKFFSSLPAWPKLLEQFTRWPRARYAHDDYPDTVALACQHFGQALLSQPVTKPKHPLLAAMDAQEAADITRHMFEEDNPSVENVLGSDFAT